MVNLLMSFDITNTKECKKVNLSKIIQHWWYPQLISSSLNLSL